MENELKNVGNKGELLSLKSHL